MTRTDDLAARMKAFEQAETGRRLMPGLPVCARLDGRAFSTWTHGFEQPYDVRLSETMIAVTRNLVSETGARLGYTQSDEITLVWYEPDRPLPFFDGKLQKLVSVLASMTTALFCEHLHKFQGNKPAQFDCRVWNVPTLADAADVLLWRELDATKNSLGMAARTFYGHAELHGRSTSDLHELLHQKGVNWNEYPAFFKRGTFVRPTTVHRRLDASELEALPPQHNARRDPDLLVERRVIERMDLPPLRQLPNRVEALFGAG